MRPRPALLLGALVLPALPLLTAGPAHAVAPIICVNRPADTDCGPRPTTITAAIGIANTDNDDSIIRIGPGTYADGPYTFDGTANGSLTVQGSNNGTGVNATVLQGGAAAPYVTAKSATVRNLRITVSGAGQGIFVSGASGLVSHVIVADSAQAVASGATGFRVDGAKVQGSTVNLDRGTGNTGIVVTGASVVSRVTTRASGTGVVADAGSPAIDNSVLDLGSAGQVGLRAGTAGATTDVTVAAKHLTVVGGAAGSRGVWAFANDAAAASSVTLDNSIVRGPTQSLAASATAGSADVDVRYSDYETVQATGGTVDPVEGNLIGVDPAFIDPVGGDHALRAGSPVVDQGSLLLTIGTDRDDLGRAVDGDRNGSPIPDMGAYELRDVTAPNTTFTSGPSGPTNDNTPVFAFRSEQGASFECQIDAGAWQKCSSPVTTTPLPDGPHRFAVRATDAVFNAEATPATRRFTIDTAAPNATITKKPPKRFFKKRIKFTFSVSEPGARLQCNLDGRGWRTCQPTFRFNVKVGKHRMQVRAVDAAGNVDSTPAHYRYKRLKHRR